MTQRSMRPYLTTTQLADYLGYKGVRKYQAARKWRERTGIPKRWRGRAWLMHPDDVDAILEGRELPKAAR